MTANQIEYWKLNETRRHNIEVENMDRPYKESATLLNYEAIATAPTQRALNAAQAGAAAASAEASYATAERQREAINTERSQQQLNLSHAGLFNVQTEANQYRLPESSLAGMYAQDRLSNLGGNNSLRDFTAYNANYAAAWSPLLQGFSDATKAGASLAMIFG